MSSISDPVVEPSVSHRMEKDPSLPWDKRNKVAQQFLVGKDTSDKKALGLELMKVKTFEKSACSTQMGDEDVHPEIINWIVDAALLKKHMDSPMAPGFKAMRGGDPNPFGQRQPENELPDYDSSVFPKIWYFSVDNDKLGNPIIRSYCPKNKDFFRQLYVDIRGKAGASDLTVGSSAEITTLLKDIKGTSGSYGEDVNRAFSLDVDKLVRHRMYQITNAPIVSGEPDSVDVDCDGPIETLDMINHGVIVRSRDGKLLRRMKDGKLVPLGEEDEETIKELRAGQKCYTTGFQGNDKDCKNFVYECLLSQDPQALQECLARWKSSSQPIFKLEKEEISQLHPVLALRILQQFGFRKYRVYDEIAGGQLYKVESAKHWVKNYMHEQFNDEEIKKMFASDDSRRIIQYLDLVSQFVNANPAILNKNYTGSSAEAVGKYDVSDYAKKIGLKSYMPIPSRATAGFEFNRLRGYLQSRPMRVPFQLGVNSVSFPFGNVVVPGTNSGMLVGGGRTGEYVLRAFTQAGNVLGSKLISHYVNSLIAELKRKGKTLDEKSNKHLQELVTKLEETEHQLIRTIGYMDEYSRLLSTLGDYSDKSVTLNEMTSCKFADRYSLLDSKYHSTENLLLDVLSKLQNLTGDDRKYERIAGEL